MLRRLSFVLTVYYWGRSPISETEARDTGVRHRYHIVDAVEARSKTATKITELPDDIKPSPKWLVIRKTQSLSEKDVRQGLLWRPVIRDVVLRLIPTATHLVAQVWGEHRLLARWPLMSPLDEWMTPTEEQRAKCHAWMEDWLHTKPPYSFLLNFRRYVLEHILPMGARTHSKRSSTSSSSRTQPDVLLARYLGNPVIHKVMELLNDVSRVRAIASQPHHALYQWVFLAVFDFTLFQQRGGTAASSFYAQYIIPSTELMGSNPATPHISGEERLTQDRTANKQRRPLITHITGRWMIHYASKWWPGGRDAMDAILVWLWIVQTYHQGTLADSFSMSEWSEHLGIRVRPPAPPRPEQMYA